MRSFITTTALFALPSTVFAAVALSAVDGDVVADSYIVKLKPNASRDSHLNRINQAFGATDSGVDEAFDPAFFRGYVGTFKEEALQELLDDEDVEYVVPNSIVSIDQTFEIQGHQADAPWGLAAISQQTPLTRNDVTALDYEYSFSHAGEGVGIDVYIVDTGVFVEHEEFEGRARWGFVAPSYQAKDGNGHGTHCAGTVAGKRYGVSKKAGIWAVKILSDAGSGTVADIVAGLQWVVKNAEITARPSIASMSLGGGANVALDDAVRSVIAAGIPVAVAAGNSNVNAANTSPARVAEAITVGAAAITSSRSTFSNFGPVVDIFAPGTAVTSAWIGSTNATNRISGTSMATPHVAGLLAYLIGKEGKKTPAQLEARLKELATPNILTGIPAGTVNLFAYHGGSDNGTPTKAPEPPTSTPTPTPTRLVTVTVTPTLTLTVTL